MSADPVDYTELSSEELELARVELQREKDDILDRMHAVVREQERRVKVTALRSLLQGLSPEDRAAALQAAKG